MCQVLPLQTAIPHSRTEVMITLIFQMKKQLREFLPTVPQLIWGKSGEAFCQPSSWPFTTWHSCSSPRGFGLKTLLHRVQGRWQDCVKEVSFLTFSWSIQYVPPCSFKTLRLRWGLAPPPQHTHIHIPHPRRKGLAHSHKSKEVRTWLAEQYESEEWGKGQKGWIFSPLLDLNGNDVCKPCGLFLNPERRAARGPVSLVPGALPPAKAFCGNCEEGVENPGRDYSLETCDVL